MVGSLLKILHRDTGELFARAEVHGELDFMQRIEVANALADDVARSLVESGRVKEAASIAIGADFLTEPQNRRREEIIGMLGVHGWR